MDRIVTICICSGSGWRNRSFIEAIYIDKDEDNSPEICLIDTDLDGRPDEKLIDRDDRNDEVKWDAIAVDIDQDGTWDKVQDIPKS